MAKKSLTFVLVLSIITPFFYLPYQAKRAEALFGIGDISLESIPQILNYVWEKIGQQIAQKMIDDMVRSTVNWAQTGFEGNPAYVINPKQYFTDIADGVAGEFILGSDLGFLCSPFQAQIRLALQRQYIQPYQFQCTLTDVVGNIDAFYQDFSEGGWDGWFVMTQNSSNNPYGAFLDAQIALDSRIASAIDIQRQQLEWNQGFLSWSECIRWEELEGPTQDGQPLKGACLERGPVQTPGSTIKAQLDKALGSGLDKLITAESLDQLISAFASGLLNRYVFGSQGLFADNNSANFTSGPTGSTAINRSATIDVDGDRVPDGYDADRDGVLESDADICYHGGSPATGCGLSSVVVNSPYFAPVCQAVGASIVTLQDFRSFINKHSNQLESGGENFKIKADAELWANRASEVSASVDSVLAAIQNYRTPYFDEMEIGTNRLANYIGKVLDSLAGDGKDLDLAKIGSGGGGVDNLKSYVADNISFFEDIGTRFGDCGRPDIQAVEDVTVPEGFPEEGGGGGGGEGGGDHGSGSGNDSGAPSSVNLNNVVWEDTDVSGWTETASLSVNVSSPAYSGSGISLNSNKANVWPDGFPLDSTTALNANAWIFVWRNGAWHASTWDWMRPGQTSKDTSNLYQPDAAGTLRGVLTNFSPKSGDRYGFMVSCLARNSTRNCSERSGVIMVTWPGGGITPVGGGGSGTGSLVGYGFPDVWINIENSGKSNQFLDELRAAGGNLTFILAVLNSDISGASNLPWSSSGGQYNLSVPNNNFYNALSSWTNKASGRGIQTFIAMYNFWMHTGNNDGWNVNPFNPANNINSETNCLAKANFMVEIGAAIDGTVPGNSSCSSSARAFFRSVWENFTKQLAASTPGTVIFQPFSEDFKDRSFNRTAVYNQILDWWGKGKFADNVLAYESTHPRAVYKDVHDSSRNFNLLLSFIIANTDDRCDPVLDGRITDMARETVRRNNASGFLVYDCQVSGSNWNSSVISQIGAALNGVQPAWP